MTTLMHTYFDVWSVLPAATRPSGPLAHLHRETTVPAPVDETFDFFADATNLEWLTPPAMHFRMLTPAPITIRKGLEIDYRIRVRGVPIPWRSCIDVWEPGVRFVDRQIVGPYRWWHHEHRFEPVPGGTRVIDAVEYYARAHHVVKWFVARDLQRIFDYRERALLQRFGRSSDVPRGGSRV